MEEEWPWNRRHGRTRQKGSFFIPWLHQSRLLDKMLCFLVLGLVIFFSQGSSFAWLYTYPSQLLQSTIWMILRLFALLSVKTLTLLFKSRKVKEKISTFYDSTELFFSLREICQSCSHLLPSFWWENIKLVGDFMWPLLLHLFLL